MARARVHRLAERGLQQWELHLRQALARSFMRCTRLCAYHSCHRQGPVSDQPFAQHVVNEEQHML